MPTPIVGQLAKVLRLRTRSKLVGARSVLIARGMRRFWFVIKPWGLSTVRRLNPGALAALPRGHANLDPRCLVWFRLTATPRVHPCRHRSEWSRCSNC